MFVRNLLLLQIHLKILLHCTKTLRLSLLMEKTNKTNYFWWTKKIKKSIFWIRGWACNKLLLLHLSLPFYLKMYNFLKSVLIYHCKKYRAKILKSCHQYFKLYLRKYHFVFFWWVNITCRIKNCVHMCKNKLEDRTS